MKASLREMVAEAARSLPQRVVAEALRITQPAVSARVNGRTPFTLDDVERLAAVLPAGERLVLVPERETVAYAERHAARAAR